jgi:hypothetical protein
VRLGTPARAQSADAAANREPDSDPDCEIAERSAEAGAECQTEGDALRDYGAALPVFVGHLVGLV